MGRVGGGGLKYINGVEVGVFVNFRGGGRGMKLSFERGGDIDIGFFSCKKYTLVWKSNTNTCTHIHNL